ncbi:hypothetical protein ACS0TY_011513 [Phlomoides rotata]
MKQKKKYIALMSTTILETVHITVYFAMQICGTKGEVQKNRKKILRSFQHVAQTEKYGYQI